MVVSDMKIIQKVPTVSKEYNDRADKPLRAQYVEVKK